MQSERSRGGRASLKTTLQAVPVYFWSDLDIGALEIFVRIRKRIPHLRFSSLYRPMEHAWAARHCHPYTLLSDKQGQRGRPIPACDDPDLCALAVLCATHGVDQEVVTDEDIRRIGIGPRTE